MIKNESPYMESHFCLVHHSRAMQWYIYLAFHNTLYACHTLITGSQYHNTHSDMQLFFNDRYIVIGPLTEQLPEILAKLRRHLLRGA